MRYLITWMQQTYVTGIQPKHAIVDGDEARDTHVATLRATETVTAGSVAIWRPWIEPAKRQRARVTRAKREGRDQAA